MATQEARRRANKKYNVKSYDHFAFDVRKDSIFKQRLEDACKALSITSKSQYIIRAVEEALTRDGYGIDKIGQYKQDSEE